MKAAVCFGAENGARTAPLPSVSASVLRRRKNALPQITLKFLDNQLKLKILRVIFSVSSSKNVYPGKGPISV